VEEEGEKEHQLLEGSKTLSCRLSDKLDIEVKTLGWRGVDASDKDSRILIF
jgi:hypothetical protein